MTKDTQILIRATAQTKQELDTLVERDASRSISEYIRHLIHGEYQALMNTIDTLQDITGQESGAVVFGDEAIICNWSNTYGIPRMFAGGVVGLGERFTAYKSTTPPAWVIQEMIQHDIDQGSDPDAREDGVWRAWDVTTEGGAIVIVVTNDNWN